MKHLNLVVIFLSTLFAFGQNENKIIFDGAAKISGMTSNENSLPFWMYTNTSTEITAQTNFSGLGEARMMYNAEKFSIEAGTTFFYRDGISNEFQRRDLYLQFENNWLRATVGAKQRTEVANGLSATNKNFLWSLNARPMPGAILEANDPLQISETFGIDWGIAHYYLNDDRFIDNTLVHYKRLALVTTFNDRHKLTAQIQHFAEWGGTSMEFGKFGTSFNDFVDVFIATESAESPAVGEQVNALGNHLGSFLLDYEFKTQIGDFSIYHEHPFEDGSGTRWANFPDGVWGVFLKLDSSKFLSSVLYEYIDTSDQSGTAASAGGIDNYFANNIYRSGWSYERNTIGLPFILVDPQLVITNSNSPIINNRVKVHHFGLSGSIEKISWQLKSSFATNLGTYRGPIEPALKNWHNYISASYTTPNFGHFTLFGGIDSSNLVDTVFGAGISYKYILNNHKEE